MSGHSKWSQIKYKKSITDAKRGKIFSKLSREISVAAREKGGDPQTNPKLRLAIEKAKEFNLPKENIERAIKRGTGELKGGILEEVIYEAYGPGGIALIIEGITDNKNRTLSEIKNILSTHNGKLAGGGSVSYLFEKKGCIIIDLKLQIEDLKNKEKLELEAIEAGAEDLKWRNDILEIYTKLEDLEKIKKSLQDKNIIIESSSIDWVPKVEIELKDQKTKEQLNKLFEALDENDDVQEIYSNLKNL